MNYWLSLRYLFEYFLIVMTLLLSLKDKLGNMNEIIFLIIIGFGSIAIVFTHIQYDYTIFKDKQ